MKHRSCESRRYEGFGELIFSIFLEIEKTHNIDIIYGWLSNDDANKDGTKMVTRFFEKRGMKFFENTDAFRWAKGLIYGNINNIFISDNVTDFEIEFVNQGLGKHNFKKE